ncbi:MAG: energy transducer TonB [Proteobacteria bacterium]|nr:energy transducer TonB [Pseudomonadota bacterium]
MTKMRVIEERPEIWPFLLLSLIIHLILALLVPRAFTPQFAAAKEELIPVEFVSEPRGKLRLADIEKPDVEMRPKKTKFLGMYDSAVQEEMVGVARRPGKTGEKGRPKPRPVKPEPAARDRIFAFDSSIFDGKRLPEKPDGSGGGAMDDFYPDLRRGPHTYLNVLRYPEVEYFVRLKRAFKVAFNPEPSLRAHFSMNQVARGSIDVVLGVSVDRTGDLAELFIFRSSGIPSYDTEALRTVRASSPFSSPPEKFMDDNLLRMTWTFTVYL